MTILNCNNEEEDDDNGYDGEEGNSDDMTGYRLFQIHRPLAGHFVTMVVRLGRVKLPCVIVIYSPPPPSSSSSSSKNNHHLTRGGICHCRHCRRQCKILASGVNFSIFTHFLCFFPQTLLKLGEIDGVKFLA